ncbi:hypothetical protein EVAR_54617_1 [Eumeta japonica]|uniref:Uncharacterized protein n=1 Tax=Eumeta variegata TaxID=151549 RepID=A0A4C1YLT2_EUMVA|nr:hypothetical protein EVAR_54617_1 [Eumeta japonica]
MGVSEERYGKIHIETYVVYRTFWEIGIIIFYFYGRRIWMSSVGPDKPLGKESSQMAITNETLQRGTALIEIMKLADIISRRFFYFSEEKMENQFPSRIF